MRKLAIVVGCTNRKSAPVPAELAVRSLDAGDTEARAEQWVQRVCAASGGVSLGDLYMGEAWQQAKLLFSDAGFRGYDADLYVVSAGLGIRLATSLGPAYSATFSRGHADSVAVDGLGAVQWWRRMRTQPGSHKPDTVCKESMLVVVSECYGQVIAEDVDRWAARCDDLLVVGGSPGMDSQIPRLPADIALRRPLGGTASSLTLRMARRWLQLSDGRRLTTDAVRADWQAWARTSRRVEVFDRMTMSDDEVRRFLGVVIREEPGISATRALRMLRDSGRACEQRRFHRLHNEVVA